VANGPTGRTDPSGLVRIPFEFNAFIPGRLGLWFREPGQFIEGPEPTGPFEWGSGSQFKGDGRAAGQRGTSRISSTGWIESTEIGDIGAGEYGVIQRVGASHRRQWWGGIGWVDQTDTAGFDKDNASVYNDPPHRRPCSTTIMMEASAGYPFGSLPTPNIDYAVRFTFTVIAKNRIRVDINGFHDAFPDYEGLVGTNRFPAYYHPTTDKGPGPLNLNNPLLFRSKSVIVIAETPECCTR